LSADFTESAIVALCLGTADPSLGLAEGGIRTGQVIGATDRKGEDPIDRRVGTGDFLATIYRHLGIDYERIAIASFAGRLIPLVSSG